MKYLYDDCARRHACCRHCASQRATTLEATPKCRESSDSQQHLRPVMAPSHSGRLCRHCLHHLSKNKHEQVRVLKKKNEFLAIKRVPAAGNPDCIPDARARPLALSVPEPWVLLPFLVLLLRLPRCATNAPLFFPGIGIAARRPLLLWEGVAADNLFPRKGRILCIPQFVIRHFSKASSQMSGYDVYIFLHFLCTKKCHEAGVNVLPHWCFN